MPASVSPKISTASLISAARDVERRDPAHDLVLAPAGQDQQPGIRAGGRQPVGQRPVRLARRAVAHELDADHQPRAADVADPVVLGGDALQAGPQLRAARDGVLEQALLADRLEDGQPGRTGDRVAGIGRAMGAATPALLELARRHDGRQGQAVGDRPWR